MMHVVMNALESQETSHYFSSSGSSLGPAVITQEGGPHSPQPLPGLCQALRAHLVQEDGEKGLSLIHPVTAHAPGPSLHDLPRAGRPYSSSPGQTASKLRSTMSSLGNVPTATPHSRSWTCAPLSLENPQSREAVTLPGTKLLPNSNPSWPPAPPPASSGLGTSASKQNLVLKQNVSLRNQEHRMQPRAAFSERGWGKFPSVFTDESTAAKRNKASKTHKPQKKKARRHILFQ